MTDFNEASYHVISLKFRCIFFIFVTKLLFDTAWKISVFGVFPVRIFPHSDWMDWTAREHGPQKLWIRTLLTQFEAITNVYSTLKKIYFYIVVSNRHFLSLIQLAYFYNIYFLSHKETLLLIESMNFKWSYWHFKIGY